MGNCVSNAVRGRQDLYVAASEGDLTSLKNIIQGAPNAVASSQFEKDQTIFHVAAEYGQLEVLKSAVQLIWSLVPDKQGVCLAPNQIPEGTVHYKVLEAVNALDVHGHTPLMIACKHKHAEVVEFLLSQGADPWVKETRTQRTALHFAAMKDDAASITAILAHPDTRLRKPHPTNQSKVNRIMDQANYYGLTPLHYAAAARAPDAVMALLQHGADLYAKTGSKSEDDWCHCAAGSTALHIAALVGSADVAFEILKYYADHCRPDESTDPRVVDNAFGQRPFQMPAVRKDVELSRMLDATHSLKDVLDPFSSDSVSTTSDNVRPTTATMRRLASRNSSSNGNSEYDLSMELTPKGGKAAAPSGPRVATFLPATTMASTRTRSGRVAQKLMYRDSDSSQSARMEVLHLTPPTAPTQWMDPEAVNKTNPLFRVDEETRFPLKTVMSKGHSGRARAITVVPAMGTDDMKHAPVIHGVNAGPPLAFQSSVPYADYYKKLGEETLEAEQLREAEQAPMASQTGNDDDSNSYDRQAHTAKHLYERYQEDDHDKYHHHTASAWVTDSSSFSPLTPEQTQKPIQRHVSPQSLRPLAIRPNAERTDIGMAETTKHTQDNAINRRQSHAIHERIITVVEEDSVRNGGAVHRYTNFQRYSHRSEDSEEGRIQAPVIFSRGAVSSKF